MIEPPEPILSERFDVEDIQKLREYNSLRHIQMTASEIIAETQAETSDFIASLIKNGNVKLPPTSPYLHLMSN